MHTGLSEAFNTAINALGQVRHFKCDIALKSGTILSLTQDNFKDDSIEFESSCLPGSRLELGATVAKSFSATLLNHNGEFSGKQFVGATCTPYVGVTTTSGVEWCPMGSYIVDECSKTYHSTISIKAVDMLLKAEKMFNQSVTFPCPLSSVLTACCNALGVTCAISSGVNYSATVNSFDDITSYTYRQVLGMIAAAMGGFCRMTRSNQLEIRQLMGAGHLYSVLSDGMKISSETSEVITIDSIAYESTSANNILVGSGNNPLYISDNPLIDGFEDAQSVIENIYNVYNKFSYTPCEVELIMDPRVDEGDKLYVDNTEEGDIYAFVASYKFYPFKKSSISCPQTSEIDTDFLNNNTGSTTPSTPSGGGSTTPSTSTDVYVDTPIYNLLRRSIYAYPLVNYSYDLNGHTIDCNLHKAEVIFGTKYVVDNDPYNDGEHSTINTGSYMWMPVLEYDSNLTWGSSMTSLTKRDWHNFKNQIMPIFIDNDHIDNTLYFTLQWFAPEGGHDANNTLHGLGVDVYVIEYPTTYDPRDWANLAQLELKIQEIDTNIANGIDAPRFTMMPDLDRTTGQLTTPAQRVFLQTIEITSGITYDRCMIVLKPHTRYRCRKLQGTENYTFESVDGETIAKKGYQTYCPIAISRACLSRVNVSGLGDNTLTGRSNPNIGFGTSENISIVSDKTAVTGPWGAKTLGSRHTIYNVEHVIGFAPPRDSDLDPTHIDYHDNQYWELESGSSGSGSGGAGIDGEDGEDGEDGVGIASLVQTTTSEADGGVNIWTATLTDGTVSIFEVRNGSKGNNGNDGVNGTNGSDGTGITDITQSGSTLTVHLSDGTTRSFTIPSSGSSGGSGADGVGIANITQSGNILTINLTDGTHYDFTISTVTGPEGPQGPQGEAGVGIQSIEQTTTSDEDGGTNVITCTLTDGTVSTFNIKNGSRGADGTSGGSSEGATSGYTNMLKITAEGIVTYTQTNAQTPNLYEELSNYIANIIMGGSF